MTKRPNAILTLGLAAVALALVLNGCGDDSAPAVDVIAGLDVSDTSSELPDVAEDVRATDVLDEEILYAGYLCEEDEACATGFCYGVATPQGAFEPARCQTGCLQLNDFRRYCDTDRDCCSGRCCIDCGPKEGLCVVALPSGTEN